MPWPSQPRFLLPFCFVLPVEFCTTLQWWFHTYSYYFHYFCSFSELILLFFNLLYYSAFSNFSFFLFIYFFPFFLFLCYWNIALSSEGYFFILCYYSTFFFLFSLFLLSHLFSTCPTAFGILIHGSEISPETPRQECQVQTDRVTESYSQRILIKMRSTS